MGERWTYPRHATGAMNERVSGPAARLGLVDQGADWDPADGWMGHLAEEMPDCLLPVIAAGPRRAFQFERIVPRQASRTDDPILDALHLAQLGDVARARRRLCALVNADVRCLEAHAHLGWLAFDYSARRAMGHYRSGVAVAERSLPDGFDGLLPWNLVDNRPFLRCLHGLATCLWRTNAFEAAERAFESLLWLDARDHQGVSEVIDLVRDRLPWRAREAF